MRIRDIRVLQVIKNYSFALKYTGTYLSAYATPHIELLKQPDYIVEARHNTRDCSFTSVSVVNRKLWSTSFACVYFVSTFWAAVETHVD